VEAPPEMVRGIGVDIESSGRLAAMVARYDWATLGMVFTQGEIDRARHASAPARHLALCFSTKEAVAKALGTGFSTIDWPEIEAEVRGCQLSITLGGNALRRAQELGASECIATCCEWEDQVIVTVVVQ